MLIVKILLAVQAGLLAVDVIATSAAMIRDARAGLDYHNVALRSALYKIAMVLALGFLGLLIK